MPREYAPKTFSTQLSGAWINANFEFKVEANQTHSANKFVNVQASLIERLILRLLTLCSKPWSL